PGDVCIAEHAAGRAGVAGVEPGGADDGERDGEVRPDTDDGGRRRRAGGYVRVQHGFVQGAHDGAVGATLRGVADGHRGGSGAVSWRAATAERRGAAANGGGVERDGGRL